MTGGDNSPAWDIPLERVPSETVTPVVRRDDKVVDADRAVGWEPAKMLAVAPFRVADIGTNAILHRAETALLF